MGGNAERPTAAGRGVVCSRLRSAPRCPAWLAQYGYNFGLLKAGYNEIPVQVWFAMRATNTVEGTQVYAFETMAGTDDHDVRRSTFVSATPIEYEIPSLAAQAWTRRGGPVQFRQAGSGSLPPLPIGPGGRLQQPKGSLFISASLGRASRSGSTASRARSSRRAPSGSRPRRRRSPRSTRPPCPA